MKSDRHALRPIATDRLVMRAALALILIFITLQPARAYGEGEEPDCFAKEIWSCGDVEVELCKLATDLKQVRVTGALQKIAGTGVTLKWGKRAPWFNGKRCRPVKETEAK
jgi:hypothetical protein